MSLKVISGGQTGVDQAGLRAARQCGIVTGGWAPHGWETQDGPAPWLADYGLVEHPGGYASRTSVNVFNSDATVRIARTFGSSGEICTMRAITKYEKPWFDVLGVEPEEFHVHGLLRFLAENEVQVLNVAGNSERTAPGIGRVAEKFLVAVFSSLGVK